MHPVLAEIIGCRDVPRLDVLRRWQIALRDQVHPLVMAGEVAEAHAQDESAVPARARHRKEPDVCA